MPSPAPLPAAATILLHAGLIAAVVAGLMTSPSPDKPAEPLQVRIVPPEPPPVAAPPTPVQPAPPQPAPPALKKERPAPRPQAETRPAPQAKSTPPVQVPEAAFEAKPGPAAAPPATVSAPPAPPASPSPVRTSASEASYAATNRTPPYPRIALSNGDEGTVILRVLVTAEGTAGAVEIAKTSGHTLLDESARRTVLSWRFKPATVDGKPVAEWYQVPIPFKLQNN
ncbi:energy transducer TonB [Noviherbaspirillum denitrificans]|uniref:energy transducer TonB n=1 Tax=Noviherbaspirillum denitrificans TaxID=1968433 RepID=UPI000B534E69|nr:energy transducer TonB [Noviherbaspirillum denitrificans]